jgi:hypothetical protein
VRLRTSQSLPSLTRLRRAPLPCWSQGVGPSRSRFLLLAPGKSSVGATFWGIRAGALRYGWGWRGLCFGYFFNKAIAAATHCMGFTSSRSHNEQLRIGLSRWLFNPRTGLATIKSFVQMLHLRCVVGGRPMMSPSQRTAWRQSKSKQFHRRAKGRLPGPGNS